jgi:hypothetical protein
MRALDELIASKLPRLHEHFTAIDLDISMLATDWYLCLYSVSLPSEVRPGGGWFRDCGWGWGLRSGSGSDALTNAPLYA